MHTALGQITRLFLAGLASGVLAFSAGGQAWEEPPVWPAGEPLGLDGQSHRVVRELRGDETWNAAAARFQLLATGEANRTIVLGADAFASGGSFLVGVRTAPRRRIEFRDSVGRIVAGWGGGETLDERFVRLVAGTDGWIASATRPRSYTKENPVFNYLGADLIDVGSNWPDAMYVRPKSWRSDGYAIRFRSHGERFLLSCKASTLEFRIVVDGRVAAHVRSPANNGEQLHYLVEFDSAAERKIEILADAFQFWGVVAPDEADLISSWTEDDPAVRCAFIGDSIAEGGTFSYPWVASRWLGFECWNFPWGATGYVANAQGARGAFIDRAYEDVVLAKPDVVVVSGGINDMFVDNAIFRREVAQLYDFLNQHLPGAVKIAVGPYWPRSPLDPLIVQKRDIIREVAQQKGFYFIDWLGWITGLYNQPAAGGNAYKYTSADSTHPTDLGRAYLGTRLAGQINRLSFRNDLNKFSNLSARGRLGSGDLMIAGFVVRGGAKQVLLRGVGPGLAGFGVADAVERVNLELFGRYGALQVNSAWSDQEQVEQIEEVQAELGAFPLLQGSGDAAILRFLPEGSYTAHLRPDAERGGIALLEVYDADTESEGSARITLANISTRGFVGAGDEVMVIGFVVQGKIPKRVLVRAVGPTLASFGVENAIPDPELALFQSGTLLAGNIDWGADDLNGIRAASREGGAFPLPDGSRDAALFRWLEPGAYTVRMSESSGQSGTGLIEVFDLEP